MKGTKFSEILEEGMSVFVVWQYNYFRVRFSVSVITV